jgi:Uncharacterized conserved protein
MIWQKYDIDDKLRMLQIVADNKGIIDQAAEKDWWVTAVLKALSNTSWGNGVLLFKGGTSLSKGWNLIERFSEDIDLIIDRSIFKKQDVIMKDETPQQRTKLRREAFRYIRDTLVDELNSQLHLLGVTGYKIEFASDNSSAMLTVVNILYESVLETKIDYILPMIKIEFSCMAMKDPFEVVNIETLIHNEAGGDADEELSCKFPTVVPERTFLEKMFLLNEEFQRNNPRHQRMARHLYDIEKIMDTDFAQKALENTELYKEIVLHRKKFYNLHGVDYNKNHPGVIDFCPPQEQADNWRSDYEKLQSTFIYGKSLTFDTLIKRLQKFIVDKIRPIQMQKPLTNSL